MKIKTLENNKTSRYLETTWKFAVGIITGISLMSILDKTLFSHENLSWVINEMKAFTGVFMDIRMICLLLGIYGVDMMHPFLPNKISARLLLAIWTLTGLKLISTIL